MAEYSDNNNVFLAENVAELPKYTGMNGHAIKLEESKQPSFGSIYSWKLVELETLKTYIKTNLVNSFIQLSKFLAGAHIFFDQKPNKSLRLYVNYWSLNNLTIKY